MKGEEQVFDEIKVDIPDYEGLYQITESGKIYSESKKSYKTLNNDPYGFENVRLYKNGKPKTYKTYELWKRAFNDQLPDISYKGMR